MNSRRASIEQPQNTRLSPNGQLIGWAVFGGLLVIGFFFGIVTGYEKPQIIHRTPKDQTLPHSDTASLTPTPTPEAKPASQPKEQLPSSPEPPKVDPSIIVPPKTDP